MNFLSKTDFFYTKGFVKFFNRASYRAKFENQQRKLKTLSIEK